MATFTYTSSAGHVVTLNSTTGLLTVVKNGLTMLTGTLGFSGGLVFFSATDTEPDVGVVKSLSVAKLRSNVAKLTLNYAKFKVIVEMTFLGEDIQFSARVENLKGVGTLKVPKFSGFTFPFSQNPVNAYLHAWHFSYTQQASVGYAGMHPSSYTTRGSAYAEDGVFGVGMFCSSHLDKQKLFMADFEANLNPPANCKWNLFVREDIADGAVKWFEWAFRLSTVNRGYQYLLAPYLTEFNSQLPARTYIANDKPWVKFPYCDITWVRNDNPYGFGDVNGTAPWRRLDQSSGVAGYLSTIADKIQALGLSGQIFWLFYADPKGAQYRPDFDVVPPEVLANWPTLVGGYHSRGINPGIAIRPGDGVVHTSWTQDSTFKLNPATSYQMDQLKARLAAVRAQGFNAYYADTFQMTNDDYLILKNHLRPNIGTEQIFAEYVSDVGCPYAGRFLQYQTANHGDFYNGVTLDEIAYQRWLVPGMPVVAGAAFPFSTWSDIAGQDKVTPILEDAELLDGPTYTRIQNWMSTYLANGVFK